MHPRNIYKRETPFRSLVPLYPEIQPFVKTSLGKCEFEYKSAEALSCLSRCLLHKDFGLDVQLPTDRLVPTIPLRLNYILWIEDLLKAVCNLKPTEVQGIDVGTGASCVYALLGAKKGWKMIATEASLRSIEIARDNVNRNNLQGMITIVPVIDQSLCLKGVIPHNKYHFSMCNPPFFKISDNPEDRSHHRPPPKNAPTGSEEELCTEGGEIQFLKKMIDDSRELGDQVQIYTTMLGCKSSLMICEHMLQEAKVLSTVTQTYRQGRVSRWYLAWSFCVKLPGSKKNSNQVLSPYTFKLKEGTSRQQANARLKELFDELQLSHSYIDGTYHLKAFKRSWIKTSRLKRDRKNGTADENTGDKADYLKLEERLTPTPKEGQSGSSCSLGDPIGEEPPGKKIKLEPAPQHSPVKKGQNGLIPKEHSSAEESEKLKNPVMPAQSIVENLKNRQFTPQSIGLKQFNKKQKRKRQKEKKKYLNLMKGITLRQKQNQIDMSPMGLGTERAGKAKDDALKIAGLSPEEISKSGELKPEKINSSAGSPNESPKKDVQPTSDGSKSDEPEPILEFIAELESNKDTLMVKLFQDDNKKTGARTLLFEVAQNLNRNFPGTDTLPFVGMS